MDVKCKALSAWLRKAAPMTVAFTGAGISTESGIPDFRSPSGVWAQFQPVLFEDFLASQQARYEYWRQKSEAHGVMARAHPSVGHEVLYRWESRGMLRGVITQNIDRLHQRAGSTKVLELHGNAMQVACLDCVWSGPAEPLVESFRANRRVPPCPQCGGRLKHATISFGQSLPADVLQTASKWVKRAELIVVIGSSLVVSPAADLPVLGKRAGARLVIINREPTPLDPMADVVIHGESGVILSSIDGLTT